MSTLKNLIKENFDGCNIMIIPWDLRETITLEDIAFISMYNRSFRLGRAFWEHIDDSYGFSCPESDRLEIIERFPNFENTCFLFAVLSGGSHDSIYHTIKPENVADEPENLFSEEFKTRAYDFCLEHNLVSGLFGSCLAKIGKIHEVDKEPFTSKYLGTFGTKRAQS